MQITATLDDKGIATATVSDLPSGSHEFRAGYLGSPIHGKSETPWLPHVVTTATETTFSSSANPSEPGEPVIMTTLVTEKGSTTPVTTGKVQIWHAGALYTERELDSEGKVAIEVPSSDAFGFWAAIYPAQGNMIGSTSALHTQFVKFVTTTEIAVDPAETDPGKPVRLTATVVEPSNFAARTGTVTFSINGVALDPTPLDGANKASVTVSSMAVGENEIIAAYSGDNLHGRSTSSPAKVTVRPPQTKTTLTGSAPRGAVPFSAPLTMTVTVADRDGVPASGKVELFDGNINGPLLATGDLVDGTVDLDVPQLKIGKHFLTARFLGSAMFAPSESNNYYYDIVKADTKTTMTLSTDHAKPKEKVTLTATVAAVAPATALTDGTVSFLRGSREIGTAKVVDGIAELDIALPYGVYPISAFYEGSASFVISKSDESELKVDLKKGPELVVNTTTRGEQSAPAVSYGLTGGAIVVWEDAAKAGDSKKAIHGRLVAPDGSLDGKEFVIVKTAEGVAAPIVSGIVSGPGTGDYAVVWQAGKDADRDVYLQILTAAGKPKGKATVVHSDKTGDQTAPVVTPYDDKGDFLVAWQSKAEGTDGVDIFAQRFDKSGTAKGALIQVNTTTEGDQVRPVATPLDTGGFAIGWSGPHKNRSSVFARTYTKSGNPRGEEFVLDARPSSDLPRLALTLGTRGGMIATWDEPDKKGSKDRNAYAAVFSGTGSRVGPIRKVDKAGRGDQSQPALMPVAGPKLAMAWTASDAAGAGISLSLFSVTGARIGEIEQANTTTKGDQTSPMLAALGFGRDAGKTFLGVWATRQAGNGDIAMQAFHAN